MLLLRLLEAGDPLVHVPAERADDADVVVVAHLAVRDDVEPGVLLVADHGLGRVVVRLGVVDVLEGDAYVPTEQLVVVPVRPRVRPDHRRRENGVDDLPWHSCLLPWSVFSGDLGRAVDTRSRGASIQ